MDHLEKYSNIYKQLLACGNYFSNENSSNGLIQLGISIAEVKHIINSLKAEQDSSDDKKEEEDDSFAEDLQKSFEKFVKGFKSHERT